ncbi:NAD(P)-dependent oxidoreductase [Streptomyces sp. ASQP_92]|uniref:NAD(P)-dependent oxidoreductase n=1 Tax=Streptomyces sp. ASQP_92 TaxID=2979116 RepID=UPI0021C231D7|nr:NAD(P)-dependent oxidoreductase [Streptomyces sp. ASQP_92]MCT9087842.1 NAD(P)-dependent oxidoreductase [Streptomyces sp. ASQP_92]
MTTKIAFLGLGGMGTPMATRLLDAGHPLTVWNRTAARSQGLAARGAAVAATPGDAVRSADVVISMLADPGAVAEVAAAAAPRLRPGTHWIEMSTIGPDAVRDLAERLPTGVTLLDAPVLGSVDKAATGELGILVGGDADGVEKVLGVLGTVTRCGPPGSAAALKLVVNTALIGGVVVVAEALALAGRLGVPAATAEQALLASAVGGAARRALATEAAFPTALAAKDLHLATATAPLPVLAAVLDRLGAHPDLAAHDLARAADRIRAGG